MVSAVGYTELLTVVFGELTDLPGQMVPGGPANLRIHVGLLLETCQIVILYEIAGAAGADLRGAFAEGHHVLREGDDQDGAVLYVIEIGDHPDLPGAGSAFAGVVLGSGFLLELTQIVSH